MLQEYPPGYFVLSKLFPNGSQINLKWLFPFRNFLHVPNHELFQWTSESISISQKWLKPRPSHRFCKSTFRPWKPIKSTRVKYILDPFQGKLTAIAISSNKSSLKFRRGCQESKSSLSVKPQARKNNPQNLYKRSHKLDIKEISKFPLHTHCVGPSTGDFKGLSWTCFQKQPDQEDDRMLYTLHS